jgi:hypothetical protein
MVNGKLGDHPLTDILFHQQPVFTPDVDALVKEVHGLGGFDSELAQLYLLSIRDQLWRLGPGGFGRPVFETDPARGIAANLKEILHRERDRLVAGR